jgi:hypothetical protein
MEDLEDFPDRPADDELLVEEFDMLELRPVEPTQRGFRRILAVPLFEKRGRLSA